jgi:tRNA pseudouridine55 synthase
MQLGDGLILLDKPAGITSFDTLTAVKKKLGTRKVGHTGTLDKFAEGLLIVLAGRLTRMVPYFLDLEKDYIAVVGFGVETDTLDPEGSIVKRGDAPGLDRIERCLELFKGEIRQTPPNYSAIHVQGQRAYKLAREGAQLSVAPRRVVVHEIEVLSYETPDLTIRIRCSKGTYIRALARDLGREAGSCASLTSLNRMAIGRFSLKDAVTPSEFDPTANLIRPVVFVKQIPGLEATRIKEGAVLKVRHGALLEDGAFVNPPTVDGDYALFSEEDELMAIVRRKAGDYKYVAVYADAV